MVIKLEDEDYICFLNEQCVHHDDYDDEIIDPFYKIFLEHLREDGKSYVFEMPSGDNGLPVIVKYEGEDDACETNKAKTRVSSGDSTSYNKGGSLGKNGQKRRSWFNSDNIDDIRIVPNERSECPLVDESYQRFLDNLKLRESSMVLQLNSVSITYEEEPGGSDRSDELGLVPYERDEPSELIVRLLACFYFNGSQ